MLGVADQGGATSQQRSGSDALLEDLRRRFDVLLTEVTEHEWRKLKFWYTNECMGLPSEW